MQKHLLASSIVFCCFSTLLGATVIYDASFDSSTNGGQQIDGTMIGLNVNLPGGSWKCGGGWEWASPTVTATWDSRANAIASNEEKACMALPLDSNPDVGYERPETLTVTTKIAASQGAVGVGFWGEVPLKSGSYPVSEGSEETEIRRGSSLTGFSGIVLRSDGCLQLYVNGSATSDPVSVTVLDGSYQTLKFTIDTSTGELASVYWNERLIQSLSSSAFTGSATHYVGPMSAGGGRAFVKSFLVTSGEEEVVAPVQTVSATRINAHVGENVTFTATSVNPKTQEQIEVLVTSDSVTGFVFSGGTFSWTANEIGSYEVSVSSTIGDESVVDVVTIVVYPKTPEIPQHLVSVLKGVPTGASVSGIAGTLRGDERDGTAAGLSVNLPGTVWYWASGYNWAPPSMGAADFNLSNESAVMLLSLASHDNYVKPTRMFMTARPKYTGRFLVGFWSDKPTENLRPYQNFTGVSFDRIAKRAQAYLNGSTYGDFVECDFSGMSTGVAASYDVRFTVDLKRGKLTDVVWNDLLLDLTITGLTDANTANFGFGSGGNGVENSRVSIESFELSEFSFGGMIIVVR